MTISSQNNITKIVITFSSGEGTNAITANGGNYNSGTWTGESQSVVFTVGGTSGHRRLSTVTVTTESAGPVDLTTFKFTESTPFVQLSKSGGSYVGTYTQTVVSPTDYDGTVTYAIDEDNTTFVGATIDAETGVLTLSNTTNAGGDVVVKASGVATDKYNAPADATYTLTVMPASTAVLTSIELSGTYPTEFFEGDEFSHDGMTVTAIFDDESDKDVTDEATFTGYDMNTVGTQEITVSYTENEVTKTTTYNITVKAIPTYNAIFSVNGNATSTSYKEGEAVVFPEDPQTIEGKVFVGWTAEAISSTADEAPEFVTSATMGTEDVTFYAVFATKKAGNATSESDELTNSTTGVSGSSYAEWSGKTATSGAVYAGQSAGGYSSIQLRSNNNNSGVITTTSGGKVTKVVVEWNSNTASGRTIDIYGSNSAYSAATDLYNSNTQGTKLGSIVCGTSTKLTVDGDYTFVGIRSNSGALYLDKITITWTSGTPDSYSDYCTTVEADTRAEAGISFAEEEKTVELTSDFTGLTLSNENNVSPIIWSSSNEDVATVENGTVTLKAVGETTITASFAGNEDYKKATVSYVLTVQDSREAITLSFAETEVEVNINETVAIPTLNGNTGNGAVSYASDDETVAVIENGEVKGLKEGTATITATVAATNEYQGGTAEFTVSVIDPNKKGTKNNPYTVSEAIDATPTSGTSANVYIHGIVSAFYGDNIVSDGSNYRYYISDDGTTTSQLLVYKGKGLNEVAFSAADDLQIGDEVVIYGGLTTYRDAAEIASGNYLISLVRVEKPATPTFSVEEGTYTEDQSVEIACATDGATIYYTIDGTIPTAQSTEYTAAISISETTTIKAIAVKDDVASDVASVTYTINKEPFITLSTTSVAATAEGADGTITVTYNNLTNVLAEVQFFESDGTTSAEYNWLVAEINEQTNNIDYIVSGNTSTEARTAYMKVYAIGDEGEAYSGLITITQAGLVVDYATLPFEWNGGTSSELTANTGVSANGLGSDYAASNAPYRVKFDTTGDYIQVKTDKQPVIASIEVKMLGGSNDSKITVQESADGETFTAVEELTISGSQNTVLFLNTAEPFATDTRYVRFYFTKGSNVGVGAITIDDAYETATIGDAGYATYVAKYNVSFPAEVTAYIVDEIKASYVNLAEKTAVPAGTPVILKGEAGTYTLTPASSTETESVSGNILLVSDGTVKGNSSTIFALANKNNTPGFYRVAEGVTVPEGKPYLVIAESGAREFFGFADDGTTTGISTVATERTADFYNLNGQRVETLKKGGLYIQGGKKVIVK